MVDLRIEPMDAADPAALNDLLALYAKADAVDRPWHPGWPASLVRTLATHGWDDVPEQFFLGRDASGTLVAAGSVFLPERENRHTAIIEARVHPDHRRRGLGSALYDHLEGLAAEGDRTSLVTFGPDSASVRGFAEGRGYALGSVGMSRPVDLRQVSVEEIEAAYAEAAVVVGDDYDLIRLPGAMPEDLLEAYVDAVAAINDAPLDDLALDDEVHDAGRIRQYERCQELSGYRLYRVLARHRASGAIAGHTVVAVCGDRPQLGDQHDTTVVGAHRGHRLGLLLKADMMRWLRDVEPDLETIGTQNAASNDHMIAVNERLGYRVLGRSLEFQRDEAQGRLAASSQRAGRVTGTA
jgi:GNAT superfamily N-acetyltransferase/RimJ/RimL family protein N-acetyltransferase